MSTGTVIVPTNDRGNCSIDGPATDPLWLQHCSQAGKKDRRPNSVCVQLNNRFDSPLATLYSGRPVNFNAFLPDNLPFGKRFQLRGGWGAGPFGWAPSATRVWGGGVDPQMIYCAPPPESQRNLPDEQVTTLGGNSGWAGGSSANAAPFHPASATYQKAMADAWAEPPDDEPFCTKSYEGDDKYKYLVWRAFCDVSNSTDFVSEWSSLKANQGFMTEGRLPKDNVLVSGGEVAKLVRSADGTAAEQTQMLFDLRNGSSFDNDDYSPSTPFQYPLTARNIADAVELACFASSVQADAGINCDDLTQEQMLEIINGPTHNTFKMGAVIACYGKGINKVVDQLVFAPAPAALVENFQKGKPLPGTGIGGNYLSELSNQYEALVRIRRGLRQVANSYVEFSSALKQIGYIEASKDAQLEANTYRQLAAVANGLAQAASALASATSFDSPNVLGKGLQAGAAVGFLAAAALERQALQADREVTENDARRQILDQQVAAMHAVDRTQAAVEDVQLAANDLNESTDNLRSSQKRAARAKSRIDWSGWAGEDGVDPQFVNTATRRIYNTRLHRYETALARAKKLAFIARRAIELRFGVDLQRQVGDLTLVEAPAKWANEVCEMQGINYAEIRDPANTIGTGEQGKFDFTNDGENFATSYIGEYVAKLEDFVNTYPFDYPLKEGDDVAVLSVADDIFGVTPACPADGRNDLYYS
ncbi:MAG: hypothetical protein KC766_23890, partial [Myxococcales bacterium]|nr:hypothetical protein [Myxococcales bacterium]